VRGKSRNAFDDLGEFGKLGVASIKAVISPDLDQFDGDCFDIGA